MKTTNSFIEALRAECVRVSSLIVLEPGMGIVVAGTGGRKFVNYGLLAESMDIVRTCLNIRFVSHGDAPGADRLFGLWARSRRIAERKLPADWDNDGNAAGPIRNQMLLDSFPRPNVVVAMPGGSGTADMVCRSNQQGFPVLDIEEIMDRCFTPAGA
ncbi:hypothetical protein Cp1R7AA1_125 [Mesorhizobium phage Cp1R7A-A1]|nr:hypothetical protein Cp1R7AA1_125 [Mesorhizobium phage Cp1R7A-A1]